MVLLRTIMAITQPSILLQLTGNVKATSNGPFGGGLSIADLSQPSIGVGTTAGNCDGIYSAYRNVTSGTPDVINLLALTDALGNAITVAHLVAVHIKNPVATTAGITLTAGGGTNPVFPAGRAFGPGGDDFWQDIQNGGIAITSGTNNNLQVVSSSGTVSGYTVTLYTRSV